MFKWLFGKESKEQKQKKDVDNIVKAMCKSIREEGRWSVTVVQYKTLYDVSCHSETNVVAKDHYGSYNTVEMFDTKTMWKVTFSVLDDTHYRGKSSSYPRSGLYCVNIREQPPRVVGDVDELVKLKHSASIFNVVVENHSEYENIPSTKQLKEVYDAWWRAVVGVESMRRYTEKQRQEMEKKQTAIDKLKQMYL